MNDSDGRVGVFCADFLNLISASSIIDQKRKTYTRDFQPDRTGTDDDDLARLPNLLLILHKRCRYSSSVVSGWGRIGEGC